MNKIVIRIPIPQKISTNKIYAGIHWTVRKKIADLYHMSLIEYKHKNLKVKNYPVTIDYEFIFKKRPLDTLNCAFMGKLIEDSLVMYDILEDDSPKFVKKCSISSIKGDRDEVIITIHD